MANTSPINILRVVPSLEMGGMEKMLVSLLPKLDKKKYNVKVCCLYRKDVLASEMEKAGIPVFCLNMKAKLDFNLKYLTGIIRLVNLLKRENIKIIHTHLRKASIPGRIAAILARVPIIISHEHNLSLGKEDIKMERLLAKFTDKIAAVSGNVRDFYAKKTGIALNKFAVIYNGVDVKKFEEPVNTEKIKEKFGIPSDCKVIGTVGRLKKVKGHNYFLQAAKIIKEQIPDTKFLVVGAGSLLQELKECCFSLGLKKDVIFTGKQKNINGLLSIMDIFVLSSISEGFGVSILEAMAKNKPVVATSVGGIPEIIKDGTNGFLIPPCCSATLAEKVLVLLNNEEMACEMAKKGKETVETKFTLKKMVNKTESLYDGLINRKLNR